MTFLQLFYAGGYSRCDPILESSIDAAVSEFLSSNGSRDALLSVTLLSGNELKVRASAIESWMVSTPESRRAEQENDKAIADELKEIRASLGLYDDEVT